MVFKYQQVASAPYSHAEGAPLIFLSFNPKIKKPLGFLILSS